MFAALTLAFLAAPVPKVEMADWKPLVKDRALKFEEAQAAAANAIAEAKKVGLTADYVVGTDGGGVFTFAKKDGPKVVIRGHAQSAFTVHGDVLYFTDFSPAASGCKVVAYDLASGKKAWTEPLAGLGPVAHLEYSNRVAVNVERHPTVKGAFALVTTGWEDAGGYVEVTDLATGRQLAHKKFAARELSNP